MGVPATAAAFRAEGLVKRFGARRALDGASMEVSPGAAMGLAGANGAGKTTFIKCALDLCAPDAGRVEIFGVDNRQAAARARLAYLPERFVPPYYLLGREFLAMTLELAGASFVHAHAVALAAELELDPQALERPVRQLSKGMTQKLGLAACFLLPRDLYLLDEPMTEPRRQCADFHHALARRRRGIVLDAHRARSRGGSLLRPARGTAPALRGG
jgi:ABC-2 type transport system ATP-binding protein